MKYQKLHMNIYKQKGGNWRVVYMLQIDFNDNISQYVKIYETSTDCRGIDTTALSESEIVEELIQCFISKYDIVVPEGKFLMYSLLMYPESYSENVESTSYLIGS